MIQKRIGEITDLACQRIREVGGETYSARSAEHKSGIVVFQLPNCDPASIRRRCLDQGVVLSCRGGRLRISPHAYNNREDIDRLVEALV